MKYTFRGITYTVITLTIIISIIIYIITSDFPNANYCGKGLFEGKHSEYKDYNREELINDLKKTFPSLPVLLPDKIMVAQNKTRKDKIGTDIYPQYENRDQSNLIGYSILLFDHREIMSGGGQLGGIIVTTKSLKPDDYEMNEKVSLSNGIIGTLHYGSKSCASPYIDFDYKGYVFQIIPDIKIEDMATFAKMFTDKIGK